MKQLKSREKSNNSASNGSHRLGRVETLLRREIGRAFLKLRDPRVGMVTVSVIKVSPDLRMAWIFVTLLDSLKAQETLEVLNKASGFFRSVVAENWSLKILPKFSFILDQAALDQMKLDNLLMQVAEELEHSPI